MPEAAAGTAEVESGVGSSTGAPPAPEKSSPGDGLPSAGEGKAQPDKGETAAPDDQTGKDGEKEAPTPKTYSQDDIRRIVARENAKAQRRMERELALRVENELLKRQVAGDVPPQRAQSSPQEPGRPRPEEFSDWDAYNEALTQFHADRALQRRFEQGSRAQREAIASQREAEFARTVQTKFAESGSDEIEDFTDVVSAPGVAFTEPMVLALMKTPRPAETAYNLALNRAENSRIAALDVADQVLAVKQFADSLAKTPAPTTAPAPIKPGKAEGSSTPTLETARDYDEWLRIRNRQLGRTR